VVIIFLTTVLKLLLALILMAIGKLNFVLPVLLLMLELLLPLKLLPVKEDQILLLLLQTPRLLLLTPRLLPQATTTLAGRTPEHGRGQVAVIFMQVIWVVLKPQLLLVVQHVKTLMVAHTSRGRSPLTAG